MFCFVYNDFNEASVAIINKKVYKLLGVKHVDQVKNWNLTKGVSNCVSVSLIYSDHPFIQFRLFLLWILNKKFKRPCKLYITALKWKDRTYKFYGLWTKATSIKL